MSLLFETSPAAMKTLFAAIACFATVNGILVQIIMASRVLYGLAAQGVLPAPLAAVHPERHTPVPATRLVTGLVLALALFLPIGSLAQGTSLIALTVFSFVNLALIRLKRAEATGSGTTGDYYRVPAAVPMLGLASCLFMLALAFA